MNAGAGASGVYVIDPDGYGGDAPFAVYCDMETAGGGWTLVGKHDRDYDSGWILPLNWGRSEINKGDMADTTTFSGRSSSLDARDIITYGNAKWILNIGDDDGKPPWDLVAILNIPTSIQNDPSSMWDPALDDQMTTYTYDTIITYDENFNNVGTSHWGCNLANRGSVVDPNSFWSTYNREGATFSNAGAGTGTRDDTVYWCFPDGQDGSECSYGCCDDYAGPWKTIGTGCQDNPRRMPTHRYNLMFMR